jgi:uncharacterized protein (TIGR03086 family)
MSATEVFPEACQTIAAVVRAAADADLDQPTPCRDWDLRTLADHFAGTSQAMATLGRQGTLDADDPWGSKTKATDGDWSASIVDNLEAMADGWSRPESWGGSLAVGGNEMPAKSIGDMALIEVLLHGWDVGTATGQRIEVSDALGRELRSAVLDTAELGRQMGAYGPEVPVSEDSSALEQALAAAGRDPQWRP